MFFFPAVALPQDQKIGSFTYELDTPEIGQATVKAQWFLDAATDISIPAQVIHEGITYDVVSIGEAAFINDSLDSVTLPDTLIEINHAAFASNNLKKISIPNNVKRIGSNAFSDNLLEEASLSDSTIVIGLGAFANNRLNSISLPTYTERIESNAFRNNLITSIIFFEKISYLGDSILRDNPLEYVKFLGNRPEYLTDLSFYRNNELSKVEACFEKIGWGNTTIVRAEGDIPVSLVRCTDSSVPIIPQQSLSKIVRTDSKSTDSTISIGGSSDDGETYSTSFSVDDEIILTAKIFPDSDDIGEQGELYVVIRTIDNGKKVFKALNEDGMWEVWNASLKSLPAAKYVDNLESVEEIEIYSGSMTAGQRLIYVGYSLFTDGKPVITTSLSPFEIEVSE